MLGLNASKRTKNRMMYGLSPPRLARAALPLEVMSYLRPEDPGVQTETGRMAVRTWVINNTTA